MRLNAASLDIRDATTSTPGTLNDLTDLIMANNNNNSVDIKTKQSCRCDTFRLESKCVLSQKDYKIVI